MFNLSRFVCIVFGAAVLLTGCKGKDGDPGPAGPAGPVGPSLTGSVIGFVAPFSEEGDNLNKSGVTVTVTSVTPQVTQTTDANGRFEFPNLKTGTYNFSFSRNGLGTYKVFGFAHLGGDQPTVMPLTYLIAVSQTTVTNFTASSPQYDPSYGGFYTRLTANLYNNAVSSPYRRVVIYISNSPSVTSATSTLLGEFYAYQNAGSGSTLVVPRSRFVNAGFASGSTAYLIAYGVPDYYNLSYVDPATGRMVFSGISPTPSQVTQVIVP